MERPKVTIIVVCYNNSPFLWQTLDSILAQDYPDIQLIVSDDASKVFDSNEIKRYCSKISDVTVKANTVNLGTVRHLNAVLPHVRGEYIKLISPGDTFVSEKSLRGMVAEIGYADVLVSPVCAYNAKITYLTPSMRTIWRLSNSEDLEQELYVRDEINIIGTLFRTGSIDGFDTNYRIVEDWPLWLRLMRQGKRFVFRENIYCNYALGGISTSGGSKAFRADVIKLFEREILPYLDRCDKKTRREARFEYEKNIIRQENAVIKKVLFIIKNIDLVVKRKYEYFTNIRRKNES